MKRILSFIMALTLLMSMVPEAFGEEFTDDFAEEFGENFTADFAGEIEVDISEESEYDPSIDLEEEEEFLTEAEFFAIVPEDESTAELPIALPEAQSVMLDAPVLTSVANTATGVTVTWNAVANADQYRVYLKTGSGNWTSAVDTADTSCTVTGLTNGTAYTFTVRCISADGKSYTSSYDTVGKSITWVGAPVLTSVSNSATGVTVKWNAMKGVAKYRVFYKTGTGSWVIGGTTSGTSYTVTGLTNSTGYSFTVRGMDANGKAVTNYDTVGRTITWAGLPVLTSVANAATGVTVKWNAMKGVTNYRVFCKTGSGKWAVAGNTTGTSYTVTGLTNGTAYSFTVRGMSADGKDYVTGYDTVGKSITWKGAPVLTSVSNTATGVTVKWNALKGVTNYRVYYKTGSGDWTVAGKTTGTSYTVTGLTNGTAYSFTVRGVAADGKTNVSNYDTVGKSITWLGTPVLTSVSNTATGVTVKWNAMKGVSKYRVFYKTSSSSWTKAADTTGTSYTVTGLTTGTAYSFTVRGISADGKSYSSNYDSVGKSITWVGTPVLTSVSNAVNGVTVTWNAMKGVNKYCVFYRTNSDSWFPCGDTTSTSYTVTGLSSGTNYVFTVRGMDTNGSYVTNYDSIGKSILFIEQLGRIIDAGEIDGISWMLDENGTLVLIGSGETPDYCESSGWWEYRDETVKVIVCDGITGLGSANFLSFEYIESVSLPSTLTKLGNQCFESCRCLTSITIPGSVTSLGEHCFSYCTRLTSITIPKSVVSIGARCFYGCSNLSEIMIESRNAKYASEDGILLSADKTELIYIPEGKILSWNGNVKASDIPSSVTCLGDYCFYDCQILKSIMIPNGVTRLGDSCFFFCENLASVTIPSTVTSLGNECFRFCYNLSSILIPNSVIEIGDFSFSACWNLASITLPIGLTKLGDGVFRYCKSMTKIIIPNGVASLGEECFIGCVKLQNIVIPDRVTSIGKSCFKECELLKNVVILGDAPNIGTNAFRGVSANVSYYSNHLGWNTVANQNYGGNLTWVAK